MFRKLLFVSAFSLLSTFVGAQTAVLDSIELKSALIVDNRLPNSNPGLNHLLIHPERSNQTAYSLGELLSRSSASFVKQYSPGSLASPSLRGTGAAHTALIWNGLNLQSSMNGQLDLSLIPAIMFDEFMVQEGAGASTWGSGAIGGSIFLQSNPLNNSGVRVQSNLGSWGFQQQAIDISLSKNKVRSRTRAYLSSNQNNFKFVNEAEYGHPIQRQLNAEQRNKGIMQDVSFQLSSKSFLLASIWYQQADRQIPPIITVPVSVAKQFDASIRASLRFQKQFRWFDLRATAGRLSEQIHFVDSLFAIDSDNHATTYIAESVAGKDVNNGHHRIEIGGNYTCNKASAAGFGNLWKRQERAAGFASIKSTWFSERLKTLLQLRQEFVNGVAMIPTPSLSGEVALNRLLRIKAQLARTYRIPTLNDLYWVPGGNPGLQPETGFSYEGGLHLRSNPTKWKIESSIGCFASKVENWIVWTPGNSYWTPQNIHSVFSRGAEFKLNADYRISETFVVSLKAHWQNVKSTVVANAKNPGLVGKQLIYIPELTGNSSVALNYRGFRMEINQMLVGHRYITSDNSDYLPAYQVLNATFAKEFALKKIVLTGYVQVNNLSNTIYQNVVWRPMPLRSWMTGITFQFKP